MPTINRAQAGGFLTQREIIDKLYAQAMKTLRGQENENVLRLLKAYRIAQDELIARLTTGMGGTTGWTYSQFEDSGRLQSLLQSIEEIIGKLHLAVKDEIEAGAMLQFKNSYDRTAWAVDQATPPDIPVRYARAPEDAVRVLVNTPYKGAMFSQRIGLINNAMASDIRDELTQSLIQGEGIQQAAERVQKVIGIDNMKNPQSYAHRARVIARSEIMRAQNMARDFTYEQNKDLLDEDQTEWLVTPDDRLCPWCLRREGLTDKEIEDSNPGDDPWGNDSEAPLHPNCRCTKVPKLKSWKSLIGLDMPDNMNNDYRGIRNPEGKWEIAPVETFDNWLERRAGELGVEAP